jgi:hypothetical protein
MSGAEFLGTVPVERVKVAVTPWQWEFAVKRRADRGRFASA